MVRDSYALGKRLELSQRVALMTRLLYTMRPEVMAEEKKQWAEELFGLAQQLPGDGTAEAGYAGTGNARRAGRGRCSRVCATSWAGKRCETTNAETRRLPRRRRGWRCMTPTGRWNCWIPCLRRAAGGRMRGRWRRGWCLPSTCSTMARRERRRCWPMPGSGASMAAFPMRRARRRWHGCAMDEDAAEDFFRQVLAVFARGQEGVFGVREFAGLLDRAVALEAISDESAEEAGRAVVAQLGEAGRRSRAHVRFQPGQ
jgi:hypothetical protein